MYGDNGRIGLIRPGVTPSTEMDFHQHLPEGMAVATCAVPYRRVTVDGLSQMSDMVKEYAGMYRGFPFDLLVFACTTGSMVGGPGFDKVLVEQMESVSGIPSITTSTALMESFEHLNVKKVSIITPYSGALNRLEADFLAAAGYETVNIQGLGIEDAAVLPFVQPEEYCRLAMETDTTGADALFISCTGISAISLIEKLEEEKGIPVITSNQATVWCAMRRIGYQENLPGLGKLGRLT